MSMKSLEKMKMESLPFENEQFKKVNTVEEAFKIAFGSSVHVQTQTVKTGGTSGVVYVPKKFEKKLVTIIVWEDKQELAQ